MADGMAGHFLVLPPSASWGEKLSGSTDDTFHCLWARLQQFATRRRSLSLIKLVLSNLRVFLCARRCNRKSAKVSMRSGAVLKEYASSFLLLLPRCPMPFPPHRVCLSAPPRMPDANMQAPLSTEGANHEGRHESPGSIMSRSKAFALGLLLRVGICTSEMLIQIKRSHSILSAIGIPNRMGARSRYGNVCTEKQRAMSPDRW